MAGSANGSGDLASPSRMIRSSLFISRRPLRKGAVGALQISDVDRWTFAPDAHMPPRDSAFGGVKPCQRNIGFAFFDSAAAASPPQTQRLAVQSVRRPLQKPAAALLIKTTAAMRVA
ncbi:MAG: hypothetical protein U0528_02495 [Anaerolineae bacterium]